MIVALDSLIFIKAAAIILCFVPYFIDLTS
ncbi:MAG: hypothetical protein ACI892_002347, partial [Marinobacter maritimus]